jgi:hypothetical protein
MNDAEIEWMKIMDRHVHARAARVLAPLRMLAEPLDDREHIRVPLLATDHRPHAADAGDRSASERAYAEMVERTQNAWRSPPS